MKPASACHTAFYDGLGARKANPLKSGTYKLLEARNRLVRVDNTISNFAARVGGKGHRDNRPLGCCTTAEADLWLKGLPAMVAHTLGHDILPAAAALGGDGVYIRIVDVCRRFAQSRAKVLLNQCDVAHILFRGGGDLDFPIVYPLVQGSTRMVDRLLHLAQSSSLNTAERRPFLEVSAKSNPHACQATHSCER